MSGTSLKHNRTKTPIYKSWEMMIQRCTNPNFDSYPWYGGRGIKICSEWYHFPNFLIDMGERPKGMSLDRLDPDKDYYKENCRWSNSTVQAINKRIRSDNTSGVKGVYWSKCADKWTASIQIHGKQIHLGVFDDKQDAIDVRAEAEELYFKPLLGEMNA